MSSDNSQATSLQQGASLQPPSAMPSHIDASLPWKDNLKSELASDLATHFGVKSELDVKPNTLWKVLDPLAQRVNRVVEAVSTTAVNRPSTLRDSTGSEYVIVEKPNIASGSDAGSTRLRDLAYAHTVQTLSEAIDELPAGLSVNGSVYEVLSRHGQYDMYQDMIALCKEKLNPALNKVHRDSHRFGEYDEYRRAATDRNVVISSFAEMLEDDQTLRQEAAAALRKGSKADLDDDELVYRRTGAPGSAYTCITKGQQRQEEWANSKRGSFGSAWSDDGPFA